MRQVKGEKIYEAFVHNHCIQCFSCIQCSLSTLGKIALGSFLHPRATSAFLPLNYNGHKTANPLPQTSGEENEWSSSHPWTVELIKKELETYFENVSIQDPDLKTHLQKQWVRDAVVTSVINLIENQEGGCFDADVDQALQVFKSLEADSTQLDIEGFQ